MSEENTPEQQKILAEWESIKIIHDRLIYLHAKCEAEISRVERFEKEYGVLNEDHDKLPGWKTKLSQLLTSRNEAEAEHKRLNNLIDWHDLYD